MRKSPSCIKYWSQRLIAFILGMLLYATLNMAQEKEYMFKTINKEDGLSTNSVISFLRDSKGFLWIGTTEGINRYDGHSFKIFQYNLNDSNTIRNNIVSHIGEDWEGRIWIGAGIYLDIYNPITEEITHADWLFNNKLKFQVDSKWDLHKDKFGHYWFSSSRQGLYRYFVAEDSLLKILDAYESKIFDQSLRVTSISEDSNGDIWAINNKGILKKINSKTSRVVDSINISKTIDNSYVVFVDNQNDLWIYDRANAQGVIHVNPRTKHIERYNTTTQKCLLSSNNIQGIIQGNDGYLWIITDHGGINIVDKEDLSVKIILNEPLNKKSVENNSLIALYKDYEDFIWMGTHKNGISCYHRDLYKFSHCKINLGGNTINEINDVNNFVEDKDGNLWIGTNGGGLIVHDKKSKKYRRYYHNEKNPNSISSDIIIGITKDRNDNLWFGTYFGGLLKWDGEKFTNFKSDTNNPSSITDDRVWDICEDSDGMLWLATLLGGVNVFNPKTNKVEKIFQGMEENTIRSNVVFDIIEDSEGTIWFGTVNGIRSYNRKTELFEYYDFDPNKVGGIGDNIAFDLMEDSRKLIWIATSNGLNILEPKTKKFKVFRKVDGLPGNKILTILEDDNNNIWVSTTNGISNIIVNYNRQKDIFEYQFINYDDFDGLQGKEFNEKSAYKTASGHLFFGGGSGFNMFHPNEISIQTTKANIVFTDFYLYSKSNNKREKKEIRILHENSITYTDEIRLKYFENMFTIEFANLNFFHPERNIYQYKLENFNNNWIETTRNNNRITYTNLDPGKYVFIVRVSCPDGTWSKETSELIIIISPPWYKTGWFLSLVIFILITLIPLIIINRINRFKNQNKLLEKSVEERTYQLSELNKILEERQKEISLQNEELNDHRNRLENFIEVRTVDLENALRKAQESEKLKSAFLANMSHEIRTPMNAIVGFSQLLKDDYLETIDRNEYIDIIQRNSDSLLVIINDILDISKIEANQINITKRPFNFIRTLEEINNYYQLKANKIKIIYIPNLHYLELHISADEVRLKQVIQNLINNALKFTEKGSVTFWFELVDNQLNFFVKDTGIGIKNQDYAKVFIPFSKVEHLNNKLFSGAGLGLAICKKIINLMDGDINFESKVGVGTTFKFTLPVEITKITDIPQKLSKTIASSSDEILIMVAEDEPANFKLIEKIFSHTIVKIHWAKNGKEVVNMFKENPNNYTLILMDIKMPIKDGIDAFIDIRKIDKNIPIVAVTAFAYESEKSDILKNNFNDYVTKPLNPKQLIKTVESIINREIRTF